MMRHIFGAMAIPLPQVNQSHQAGETERERECVGRFGEAAQFNADSQYTPTATKSRSSSPLQ